MKIISAIFTFLIVSILTVSAQWSTIGNNISNTNTGNVSIGSTTPLTKLDVVTTSNAAITNNLRLINSGVGLNTGVRFGFSTFSGFDHAFIQSKYEVTALHNLEFGVGGGSTLNGTVKMTLMGNGNLGIGTTSPVQKLDVNGIIRVSGLHMGEGIYDGSKTIYTYALNYATSGDQSAIYGYRYLTNSNHTGIQRGVVGKSDTWQLGVGNSAYWLMGVSGEVNHGSNGTLINASSFYAVAPTTSGGTITNAYGVYIENVNVGTNPYAIYSAGGKSYFADNIGIGTTAPLAKLDVSGNIYCRNTMYIGLPDAYTTSRINGYALAVNGAAIFNIAKVKSYGNWPDYVFDEKSVLLPLQDLEKFIKTNKHLPEVPTAAEVEKEGINLGNTQTILLKKIEELTLYMIELNKKVEVLSKENELLRKNKNCNTQ